MLTPGSGSSGGCHEHRIDQWTRGTGPITGIGTTMGHGSWPIYTAPEKPTSWRGFWRNPDTNGGDLWSQPGRFGTIRQWFPRQTGMWWIDVPNYALTAGQIAAQYAAAL